MRDVDLKKYTNNKLVKCRYILLHEKSLGVKQLIKKTKNT